MEETESRARHCRDVGRGRVLDDGVATAVGNVFETFRPILVGTSEDYADELVAPGLGGGGERMVYGRSAEEVRLLDGERDGGVVLDEEVIVGGCDVDEASLDGLFVIRLDDGEGGLVVESLDESGAHMLQTVHADDDGEREVGTQGRKDSGDDGIAAGGASDDDCLEILGIHGAELFYEGIYAVGSGGSVETVFGAEGSLHSPEAEKRARARERVGEMGNSLLVEVAVVGEEDVA